MRHLVVRVVMKKKSRAKERVYSFRDTKHRWDPKTNVLNFGIFTMVK